jgi:hypothetical protein
MAFITTPMLTEAARGMALLHEFTGKVVEEWKAWLTGSIPMAGLTVVGLVNPAWTAFPFWLWGILIFVAGLWAAMFHVYRKLRQQHDDLRARLSEGSYPNGVLLIRLCPLGGVCAVKPSQNEVNSHDV